jgi:hypothetical protein
MLIWISEGVESLMVDEAEEVKDKMTSRVVREPGLKMPNRRNSAIQATFANIRIHFTRSRALSKYYDFDGPCRSGQSSLRQVTIYPSLVVNLLHPAWRPP